MLILFIVGFIVCTINVNALANPYSQYFKNQTNCTWYTWKMAYEKAGVALPNWGNANTWYESAKRDGYSVGTTPKPNSIAIWTKCDGDCGTLGHVGYVVSVAKGGKTLYIKDSSEAGMNGCPDIDDPKYKECIANGVSEETDRICLENAPRKVCAFTVNDDYQNEGYYTGDITQFIYLDDAPKTPVTNNNSNNNSSSTKPVVTEKPKKEEKDKSSNTNIKELVLSEGKIDCSNEVNEYELEVENDIDSIKINLILEDEKANFEGLKIMI